MTGQYYVSESALEILRRFFWYFKALPENTRKQLRMLAGNGITLGEIIDKQIEKGLCVETTASDLSCILQQNSNQAILTLAPEMSPLALKELNNKYGPKNPLNTKKDNLIIPVLHTQLTKEAIKRITLKTEQDLIDLILNFPPSCYEVLWDNITINHVTRDFKHLGLMIKNGLFNHEQNRRLLKQSLRMLSAWNNHSGMLRWALINTNDPVFFRKCWVCLQQTNYWKSLRAWLMTVLILLYAAASYPILFKNAIAIFATRQKVRCADSG